MYPPLAMIAQDSVQEVTLEDRLRGAIWGQFVGDAAALGTHWIYDLQEMKKLYPEGVNGFEAPQPGHYHYGKQSGDQTHYGDGALVLLQSIAKQGRFDLKAFGSSFLERFTSGSYSGYIDKATKGTVEKYLKSVENKEPYDYQQGADDDEPATGSRLASLVARHWNDRNLSEFVGQATRFCQNHAGTVAYMKFNALLLCELFQGRDVHTALHRAEEQIVSVEPQFGKEVRRKSREALEETVDEVVEATLFFGQSCPLPRSFPSSIHALLKHTDDFETAILSTLRAGGDSAGRAAMLGAWLGARRGLSDIPKAWRTRLTQGQKISEAVEKIVSDQRP
ncbi:MAG: ADP-ribosylglycohydrolase family protein [Acidobacteria bacterium]|nr:MAG: ADP-ribosylglycohydrolase family protein [Acidobacteriota bacterium]